MASYDTLLQNATGIITICDSYFITKCDRSLLQNASRFLLQNATVITKCDVHYKLREYNAKFLFKKYREEEPKRFIQVFLVVMYI